MKTKKQIVALALLAGSIVNVQATTYPNGGPRHTTNIGGVTYPAVNTRRYNASGSNRTGIQNAINTASSRGGGTANLANKTWSMGAPANPKSKVRLRGSSPSRTILRRTFNPTTSDALILHDTKKGQRGRVQDVNIDNLLLDGNYTTRHLSRNDTFHGCYFNHKDRNDYHYRVAFSHLKIQRFNVGILLGGLRHVTLSNTNIDQCGASNLAHNWYGRKVGNVKMTRSTIQRSIAGSGVKSSGGGADFSWVGRTFIRERCTFRDNNRTNLNVNANGYERINNNTITGSRAASGIFVGYSGPNNNSRNIGFNTDIYNNIVENNRQDGIYGEYCTKTWLRGNRCRRNDRNQYATLRVNQWDSDRNER